MQKRLNRPRCCFVAGVEETCQCQGRMNPSATAMSDWEDDEAAFCQNSLTTLRSVSCMSFSDRWEHVKIACPVAVTNSPHGSQTAVATTRSLFCYVSVTKRILWHTICRRIVIYAAHNRLSSFSGGADASCSRWHVWSYNKSINGSVSVTVARDSSTAAVSAE